MYLRQATALTLEDVGKHLDGTSSKSRTLRTKQMSVNLRGAVEDHVVKIGQSTVAAPPSTVDTIAGFFSIPAATMHKLDPDMQQYVVNELLKRRDKEVSIVFGDAGITAVREGQVSVIDPRRYIDICAKTISPKAPVQHMQIDNDVFSLDVTASAKAKKGVGGDRKVGDLTLGGVRLFQNRKRNLAPQGAVYLHRLICTNGMEVTKDAMHIDARGASAEDQVAALARAVEEAYGEVEADIAAFYALRDEHVANPERTLIRIANEQGLPDRTISRLASVLPAYIEEETDGEDEVSMFDIVNLVTNQANEPNMRGGSRNQLQRFGGFVVTDHADRCTRCQSKLSH